MRTPLYEVHERLGAKFTQFAGWIMPLEYSSLVRETLEVRSSCGLFDISHMGRLLIKGELNKLEYVTSRVVEKLKKGKVQYNLLMNEKGGVKDDITLYRLSEEEFFLCVNAINKEKVVGWLKSWGLQVKDLGKKTLQFALQGPRSVEVLQNYLPVKDMGYYHFEFFDKTLVSRTGYTGEDGFEIYAPLQEGMELFSKLLKDCAPCGLGARDVLRIEAGMPLYGHELSEDVSPFEAGLEKYVSLEKDFLGKGELMERPLERKLFGLELLQRGVPREGYELFHEGEPVGYVSSGTFSPNLQKGIALCFVKPSLRVEGLEVELDVRGKKLPAKLRNFPFLKKTRI
ncbi:MAG: glycine cleavage system aminomethyltransferase GcvT [Aquificaceae bacterium]|nr:glycine cleavage system aminomethyltransferase GcvT [Aquificaceae bacterium]MDW8294411.1 glycine cleavage system aminomethyltransferase GcvT [Aquificaceae bacterium]